MNKKQAKDKLSKVYMSSNSSIGSVIYYNVTIDRYCFVAVYCEYVLLSVIAFSHTENKLKICWRFVSS